MPKIIEKETKQLALSRLVRGDDIDQIAKELEISVMSIKNWLKKAKEENFIANVHIGPKPSEKAQEEVEIGQFEGIVHKAQKHPNEQESTIFSTRIMQEASALVISGFEVESITQGQDYKKIVNFKNTPELQRTLAMYWSGDLKGSLCEFNNKMYELMGKRIA